MSKVTTLEGKEKGVFHLGDLRKLGEGLPDNTPIYVTHPNGGDEAYLPTVAVFKREVEGDTTTLYVIEQPADPDAPVIAPTYLLS